MAKAASPIRLQAELLQAATSAGKRLHRSAAEQIEYWASLGRGVAGVVTPDDLLAISTGLARLKVEPVEAPAIDPDEVFTALERDREAGILANSISDNPVRYQASTTNPGQLEQIAADGRVTVGQFSQGEFVPQKARR